MKTVFFMVLPKLRPSGLKCSLGVRRRRLGLYTVVSATIMLPRFHKRRLRCRVVRRTRRSLERLKCRCLLYAMRPRGIFDESGIVGRKCGGVLAGRGCNKFLESV